MTPKSSPIFSHLNLLQLPENIRWMLMEEDAGADEHVLQCIEYLRY